MSRTLTILLAFDHLVLALLTLGNCKTYEMISSAAFALELQGKFAGRVFRPMIDGLARLFGQREHCRRSYVWQANIYMDGSRK